MQGLKQEGILNQGGPVFTIFEHSFQVRGAETMCIPLLSVFMHSVLKFEFMWFGFGVVCTVI